MLEGVKRKTTLLNQWFRANQNVCNGLIMVLYRIESTIGYVRSGVDNLSPETRIRKFLML